MFFEASFLIILVSRCLCDTASPTSKEANAPADPQQLSGRFFLPPGLLQNTLGRPGVFQNILRPGAFQDMLRPGGFQNMLGPQIFENMIRPIFQGGNNGFQGGNSGFQGGSSSFNGGFNNGRPGFATGLGQFASGWLNGFQSRPGLSGFQPTASTGFQTVPGSSGTGFQSVPGTGPGSGVKSPAFGSGGGSSGFGSGSGLLSGYNYQTESGFIPGLISVVAPFFGRYEPYNNNNRRFLFGR